MQVGLMAPQGWKGEYDGWAAADAFRDEQTATGISLAGLAAGFYVANIVGSIESARRHNEWQYERVQAGFPE